MSTSRPTPRAAPVAFVVMLLAAGFPLGLLAATAPIADAQALPPSPTTVGGEWERVGIPAPGAYGGTAASIGGTVYLAFPYNTWGSASPSLYRLEPMGGWGPAPDAPFARGDPTGAAVEGRFYITGGSSEYCYAPCAQVDVFDPVVQDWSQAPPVPRARFGSVAAGTGSNFLVMGGWECDEECGISARVDVLDVQTGEWSRLDMPGGLVDARAVTTEDGAVWIAGGFQQGEDPYSWDTSDRVYRLDPILGGWQAMEPLPGRNEGFGFAACGNALLVAGGIVEDARATWMRDPLNGTWVRLGDAPVPLYGAAEGVYHEGKVHFIGSVLDPHAHQVFACGVDLVEPVEVPVDHWQSRAGHPSDGVFGLAAGVLLGDLVAIGGYASWSGNYLDGAHRYDGDADRWEPIPSLPSPRAWGRAVGVDGKLLYVGGNGPSCWTCQETYVYDPAVGLWVEGPALPRLMDNFAAATDGRRVFLTGGWDYGFGGPAQTLVLDVAEGMSNGWVDAPAPPIARNAHAALVLGDAMYLVGGTDLTRYQPVLQVDVLDLATSTWSVATALPRATYGPTLGACRGDLLVFEGYTDAGIEGKVWRLDRTLGGWREEAPQPVPSVFAAGADTTSALGVHLVGGSDNWGPRRDHHLFRCQLLTTAPPGSDIGGADLVITDVDIPEVGLQAGHLHRLFVTVANIGFLPSLEETWLEFVLDDHSPGWTPVPRLAPGESRVLDLGHASFPEGTHTWSAFIDAAHVIHETAEHNNRREGSFVVEPLPTRCQEPGPDAAGYTCRPTLFAPVSPVVGTRIELSSIDGYEGPFPLPFPMRVYDVPRTQYWLSDDGRITFAAPSEVPDPNSGGARTFDLSMGAALAHAFDHRDVEGTVDIAEAVIDGEAALVFDFQDTRKEWSQTGGDHQVQLLASGRMRVLFTGFDTGARTWSGLYADAGRSSITHFDAQNQAPLWLDGIAVEYAPGLPRPDDPSRPDLVVLHATPSRPTDEERVPVTFDARIANLGAVPAGAFDVVLQEPDRRIVDRHRVDALPAGATVDVRLTWTNPPPGAHVLSVIADPDAIVAESIETNNAAPTAYLAREHFAPDLDLIDLGTTPAEPREDEGLLLHASILNEGTATSSATRLVFLLRGEPVDEVDVPPLVPGARFEALGHHAAGLPPGTWTIGGTVDFVPGERDTENNAREESVTVTPRATAPDLTIHAAVRPLDPAPGDTVELVLTVANAGDGTAGGSTLTGEADGVVLFSHRVPALAPEGTHTIEETWTATRGHVTLRFTADADGEVAESDESNNVQRTKVLVRQADLLVTDVEIDPAVPTAGDLVRVRATIRNEGTLAAPATATSFHVDGTNLGLQATPALQPGESAVVSSDLWLATGGIHRATAAADAGLAVDESDEDDNARDRLFVVVIQAFLRPELVVLDLTWDPEEPTADDVARGTAIVANQGAVPATGFDVKFTLDNVTDLGTVRVTALAPGALVEVESLPWDVGGTPVVLVATVDPRGEVTEMDEANNVRAERIVPKAPDLVVVGGHVTIPDPVVGESPAFAATVQNVGDHPSPPTTIRFVLDATTTVGTHEVPSLAPGESFNVTTPAWDATRGPHTVGITADLHDVAEESNETNNADSFDLFVKHYDLTVGAVTTSPASPQAGQSTRFYAFVRNIAPDASGPVHVRFVLDGVELGNVSVPNVPPGGGVNVWSPLWTATAGMHGIDIVADSGGVLRESDETNNRLRGRIPVGAEVPCATPGPDAAGYTCRQAPYEFIDVASTGTVVSVVDDIVSSAQPIGFAFPFYGVEHTTLRVAPNGFLSFTSTATGCCTGQALPDPAAPNDLIAAYWEDLYPGSSGKVRRQLATTPSGETAFIVQFTDVPHYCCSAAPSTFQFQLFPSGDARVQYKSALSDGGNHGAGIEDATGTKGLRFAYGNWQQAQTGIEYKAPRAAKADLRVSSVEPQGVSPQAGDSVPIWVQVENDGADVAEGFRVRVTVDGATVGEYLVPALAPGGTAYLSGVTWTATGGWKTITATADVTSVVPESNEANNALSTTKYVRWPDLRVQSFTVAPADMIRGQSAYLNVTVVNGGDGDSRVTAHGKIEAGGPIGLYVGFHTPPLAVGATWNFSYAFGPLKGGDYTSWLTLDDYNMVAESNEGNNGAQRTWHVKAANLDVPDLTWTPASPANGDAVTFRATVRNTGDLAAEPSTLRIARNGTLLAEVATPGLPPGASLVLDAPVWTAVGGNHGLVATADVHNVVNEISEFDNSRSKSLRVRQADLVLLALDAAPVDPADGDLVTLTARVRNGGDADAPLVVRFDASGAPLGDASLPVLAAGATANVSLAWSATGGDHVLRAVADPDGAVGEISETNNAAQRALRVRQPALSADGLDVAPADPVHGDTLTLSTTVSNAGDADAQGVLVRFLLDGATVAETRVDVAIGEVRPVTTTAPAIGGDRVARVEVDADDAFREVDETDNAATRAFRVRQADLVAGELGVAPASPAHGETATLSLPVTNEGDADAPGFIVRFFDGEAHLADIVVDGLGAGATSVATATFTAAGGERDLRAFVDADGDVEESDETDNEGAAGLHVRQADLATGALVAHPASPVHGEATTFTLTVRNDGDAASAPTRARFLVDGEALGEVDVAALAPGATVDVAAPAWTAKGGARDVRAILDPDGEVAESDETDNAAALALHVRQVDLAARTLHLDPASPAHRDAVALAVDVENHGDADAPAFVVRFLVDGAPLGETTVPSLAEGATLRVEGPAWTALGGPREVRAVVDAAGDIEEGGEGDNLVLRAVHVRQANLVVTSVAPTVADPGQGDAIAFRVTVRNAGDAPAAGSSTRLVLDGATFATLATPALAPGATVTLTSSDWTATGGAHTIAATADADGAVEESSEVDNAASTLFLVRQPDLVVGEITYQPRLPTSGKTMTFTAVITNQGQAAATAFKVKFTLDGNVDLGNAKVVSLAPGQSITVSSETGWRAEAGLHTIEVFADRKGDVAESDETNNQRSQVFAVA